MKITEIDYVDPDTFRKAYRELVFNGIDYVTEKEVEVALSFLGQCSMEFTENEIIGYLKDRLCFRNVVDLALWLVSLLQDLGAATIDERENTADTDIRKHLDLEEIAQCRDLDVYDIGVYEIALMKTYDMKSTQVSKSNSLYKVWRRSNSDKVFNAKVLEQAIDKVCLIYAEEVARDCRVVCLKSNARSLTRAYAGFLRKDRVTACSLALR